MFVPEEEPLKFVADIVPVTVRLPPLVKDNLLAPFHCITKSAPAAPPERVIPSLQWSAYHPYSCPETKSSVVYEDAIYTATSLPSLAVTIIGVVVVAPLPVTVARVSDSAVK